MGSEMCIRDRVTSRGGWEEEERGVRRDGDADGCGVRRAAGRAREEDRALMNRVAMYQVGG